MMAILTLFISAKFGLSETTTGYIYSAFYASIYILALAGGIIADKTKNFKGTILAGLVMICLLYTSGKVYYRNPSKEKEKLQ